MMAFITVKPEIKHNLAKVARELKIDEELLKSANRSAQKHQLYCPGYMIQENHDKELQTIQEIKNFLQPRQLDLSDNWIKQEKIYDGAAVEKEVKKIIHVFPFVSCREIGRSVLGRPIWELKAGGEHAEKKVHMNASFHANEWITTSVL
ncbi:M14 family zinc carboxypeptidase, partial [Bacillus vallismortis]